MSLKIRISRDGTAVFLLCLLCVCLLSPYVARTVGDIPIFLLTFLYLLLEINGLLRCDRAERNTMLLVSLYIAVLFIYKEAGLSTASISYHYGIVKFFIPFFCFAPLYRRLTRKQSRLLLLVLLATVLVTTLQNFELKNVWKSMFSQQLYRTRGVKAIVTTQYTSAILFLTGILFCVFLRAKRPFLRMLALAGVIFCLTFNIRVTQRGIVLILTVFMLPLLALYNGRVIKRRVVATILVILLILLVIADYRQILGWLAQVINSDRLTNRINSIIRLVEAGGLEEAGGGSLTARLRLILVSIETFFSSIPRFLFGVGLKTDSNELVGNHGQLFDEFARFGFIGGLLSLLVTLRLLKMSRSAAGTAKGTVLNGQITIIFLVFILRDAVGMIYDPAIGAVMFIGLPLVFRLLREGSDYFADYWGSEALAGPVQPVELAGLEEPVKPAELTAPESSGETGEARASEETRKPEASKAPGAPKNIGRPVTRNYPKSRTNPKSRKSAKNRKNAKARRAGINRRAGRTGRIHGT